MILLGITNLEYDLDERMERRDPQGREVRPRIEAQAVRAGGRLHVAGEQASITRLRLDNLVAP